MQLAILTPLKIEECIYKGVLHHTDVAIKLFDADSSNGPLEYWQEVEAMSRPRHPNIVLLIGTCPEALAIIYENIPNGSLKDRLICRNNSFPLPWQTRICIAADLFSVLVFLHSNKSHCIKGGELKPDNILLDANFKVKLNFRIFRAMTTFGQPILKYDVNELATVLSGLVNERAANGESCPNISTMSAASRKPKPLDTDITTKYTPELDVYSFGIILLRLLTGREAWGITKEVQVAFDSGNLDSLLDCLAGDWPYVQAQQLAQIAVTCCDARKKYQPDIESHVLGVLQKMKASCQGYAIGARLETDPQSQAPPYYICPISQDVMQDPHVAADGFTYEKDGIQGWLNSGHDTSPMTNLKLKNAKLVPNHSLRSAIQEWMAGGNSSEVMQNLRY